MMAQDTIEKKASTNKMKTERALSDPMSSKGSEKSMISPYLLDAGCKS